ncbi:MULTISPECIES: ergothioneine biosynthesis glutamate--cysteine ligase EgtA [unclassified Frankia]|uniref:ergothioneine biosynthesis glutamate--cysteine ligase EgtA n=1 Tax=unclassified Frankia TaxID=2632575 RepID=UPI001EF56356|nr:MULTISPECIES: ergothioneine biosynthesis glutamate--cysteine ligase EgtA [unclassified Frankia]
MTRTQSGKPQEDQYGTDDAIRSAADVHRYARLTCLTDQPPGSVGIETEWFVVDTESVSRPVPPARTMAALTDAAAGSSPDHRDSPSNGATGVPGHTTLPGGTRITFEPGGQLELSAPPLPLSDALARTAADLARIRSMLTGAGLALVGMGTDPLRPPHRHLTTSRYQAMERYFQAGGGSAGMMMMCSTASVQVNLDAGSTAQWPGRFELAHTLGPALVAMFAASPMLAGIATGYRSTRQALWSKIDRSRTRPVATAHQPDPAAAWADYLLAARVMLLRDPDGGFQQPPAATTFGEWVAGDSQLPRIPTVRDLIYHATTVFPPVRPRGWLELRYLDATPAGNWPVVVAVTTALLDDARAADIAADVCLPVAHEWATAALRGLRDAALHKAARACAGAARDALGRMGAATSLLTAVDAYFDAYVEPGRCPADDLIDRLAEVGPAGLLRAEIDRNMIENNNRAPGNDGCPQATTQVAEPTTTDVIAL